MKTVAAALLIAVLATPAFAQGIKQTRAGSSPEEIKEKAERAKSEDRAYNAAIGHIPEKKTSSDPWGNVRGSGSALNKSGVK